MCTCDVCRLMLSEDQVDLWIIHRGGFIIDLLAGFALSCQSTRLIGVVFVTAFHLMNSFIFAIGQSLPCLFTYWLTDLLTIPSPVNPFQISRISVWYQSLCSPLVGDLSVIFIENKRCLLLGRSRQDQDWHIIKFYFSTEKCNGFPNNISTKALPDHFCHIWHIMRSSPLFPSIKLIFNCTFVPLCDIWRLDSRVLFNSPWGLPFDLVFVTKKDAHFKN